MLTAAENEALDSLLSEVWGDPEAYAEAVFPWGEGALRSHSLRTWQREFLRQLRDEIYERGFDGISAVMPIMFSTVTGHGVGKSAINAIVGKFLHDTMPHSRGTVTANTSEQLKTKTWAEVGKWHSMSLTKHRSNYRASRGNMMLVNKQFPTDWYIAAYTCTKENAEAFQGQHATDSSSFYMFDEASAIPKEIWDAAKGGLTDGMPMMFCWGNGTRNSGQFYDTHHRDRNSWIRRQLDAREVEGASQDLFAKWIEQHGIDSDFVKVRVLGKFPSQSSIQFIPTDLVEWCMREVKREPSLLDALVYGVDVARKGMNESVIAKKRGRHHYPITQRFQGITTDQLADIVLNDAQQERPDAIFVDGDGVGGGVVDILNKMNCPNVFEVHGASTNGIGRFCHNRRAQNYYNLREAMKAGAQLPDDEDLKSDLISVEFGFNLATDRIVLESKEDAMKRGVQSPDLGDATALLYTRPVIARGQQHHSPGGRPGNVVSSHNPNWRH